MRYVICAALLTLSTLSLPQHVRAQSELPAYERNMTSFGQRHCDYLKTAPSNYSDPHLAATYYDAERVYFNIRDYTRITAWADCAAAAERIYRDTYVLPSNGGIPGYWNFTRGLYEDFIRKSDTNSRKAISLLTLNCAFCADTASNNAYLKSVDGSRENAYILEAYINEARITGTLNPRAATLVDNAIGHVRSWFLVHDAPYVRPFMAALTAEALIEWNDYRPDARVLAAIQLIGNGIYPSMWLPTSQAFKYTDRETSSGGEEPAPDLNLLIVPLYGYLYKETKDENWKRVGDEVFNGGVRGAYLTQPKIFNQNYRWSASYLKWRNSVTPTPAPPTVTPTATATATPVGCGSAVSLTQLDCRVKKLESLHGIQ